MHNMKKRPLALLAGLTLLAACKDSTGVPDLNNVTTAAIANGLNRASVGSLISGLLDRTRQDLGVTFYIVFSETLARDLYRLDPAESRFVTETLIGTPDPGGFIGAGVFTGYFIGIRTANIILNGIDKAPDLSAAEKNATKGFVNTFKANFLYHALELRDTVGLPIDLNRDPAAALAPIRCKTSVLSYIIALLDTANTQLTQAGATAFPFNLPPGFTMSGVDLSTVSGFQQFNRGLRGKVTFYSGLATNQPSLYTDAITSLNASFLSTAVATPAALQQGLYATYSNAPGESSNGLSDGSIHLNPTVLDTTLGGLLPSDLRTQQKIVARPDTVSRYGFRTAFDITGALASPQNQTRPIPILKNAELILLRAQAEIELNQFLAATQDINFVRTIDGGLPPIKLITTVDEGRTRVLYEKRAELLLEGAQRLVDLRAYGRLKTPFVASEGLTDNFTSVLPLPKSETDARNGNVTPVCP
ncbi:MAG: hypothetical protein NVS4B3_11920 [Gemmatimonadaceae bacterium]